MTARNGQMLVTQQTDTHTHTHYNILYFTRAKQLSKKAMIYEFSRHKYPTVPCFLLVTSDYLNPWSRPLLQNPEISRKQICFMGYVSLSAAHAS